MNYAEYSSLIDTGLIVALAVIVWAAYRELRSRQTADIRRP
jgi:hypothetical protein